MAEQIPGWEIILSDEDNLVGVVDFDDGAIEDYDRVKVNTELLRRMLDMADSLEWESVCISIKRDLPVFIEPDGIDSGAYLCVAPMLDDESE